MDEFQEMTQIIREQVDNHVDKPLWKVWTIGVTWFKITKGLERG